MKRRAGMICMILGAVLIGAALSLFLYNEWDSARAEERAEQVLEQMQKQTEDDAEEEEEEEFASAALFFSLISSIDFTPVDATEGANLLSPIQCSNVNRGLYASLASSIATSTVGLLVALVFLGRIRARSAHSLFNRSPN